MINNTEKIMMKAEICDICGKKRENNLEICQFCKSTKNEHIKYEWIDWNFSAPDGRYYSSFGECTIILLEKRLVALNRRRLTEGRAVIINIICIMIKGWYKRLIMDELFDNIKTVTITEKHYRKRTVKCYGIIETKQGEKYKFKPFTDKQVAEFARVGLKTETRLIEF